MTPQPQQHCEHERVCYLFIQNCFTAGSPCLETCEDDTRSRPAPAPLCDSTDIPTQNEFIAEFVGNEERKRKEHDATIAAQAREEAWKWMDDYADEDTLSVSFILLKINQLRQEAQR